MPKSSVYVKVRKYVINKKLRDIYFKISTKDYESAETDKKYRYYVPWKKNKNIRFYIGTNVKL